MYGQMQLTSNNFYNRYSLLEEHTTKNMSTLRKIGQSLNLAVERFITIGENIVEENADIKADMYDAAKDARNAGNSIEHLCEKIPITILNQPQQNDPLKFSETIILAARSLLSSVTRILLLVDMIIVKKLLTAKRSSECLEKLEPVMNFTEFVRAFSMFGIEMVELAYLTRLQNSNFKEERRRAQMFAARQILERSISILLTSSKNTLVHNDCDIVKENRDTVFCQIRRAMDIIHFVVKDSIINSLRRTTVDTLKKNSNYENESLYSIIQYILALMDNCKLNINCCETNCERNNNVDAYVDLFNDGSDFIDNYFDDKRSFSTVNNYLKSLNYKKIYYVELSQELIIAFEKLLEKAHDFTDSPYVSHEHRKNILLHIHSCKIEFNNLISYLTENKNINILLKENVDTGIRKALKDLCKEFVISISNQMIDFNESLKLSAKFVKNLSLLTGTHDLDYLATHSTKFHDNCDHIFDICKLLQHIAPTECLQVQAKSLAINLRIYGPQVFCAAKILWRYTTSSVANDNFEAFSDLWKWLIGEIASVAKKILSSINIQKMERPNQKCEGVLNTTQSTGKIVEQKDMVDFPAIEDKTEGDGNTFETKWNEDMTDDNDILKRAKNMSAMAFLMYQFTKGYGTLRTTQDLFTQAEYFAEEANRLYKVLRHFSYQVPASDNKKDLLSILDRVPTFVQALQFTVKDHTVGKAATFVKVDHVIRETKNLMNVINKVVSKCFECATKYKLNLTGITNGITPGSVRVDDSISGGMGDSKGTTSSSEGSM